MAQRHPRDRRFKAAIERLESLERAGVRQLPRPKRRATSTAKTPANESVQQPQRAEKSPAGTESNAAAASVQPKARPAGVTDSLAIVQQEVAACTACRELAGTRTQTVFGVGNPHSRLVFLGEAPGADEDRQGEPFVGRAGQLLTKIIEACQLKREDVYILNVLKCRPPGNRNPLPNEVANCRGFLNRQLALIKPEFICCLGSVAAHTLLETDTPIGRLRGKLLLYQGIPVVCTYHPAYLLRNPAAKKDCWEDMKLLMRQLGVEL